MPLVAWLMYVKERSAEQQLAVIRDAAHVGDALRDQVLAHRVALHVAVRIARGNPQHLERRRLSFSGYQLLRVAPDRAANVSPCERSSRVRRSGARFDRLLPHASPRSPCSLTCLLDATDSASGEHPPD